MALELTTNFATSTVATAPSPATSGTTLVVQSGHGARFPAGAQDFNAVVCPADSQPTPANAEIVRVTSISTDTFTITRAQESTSARTIVVGDRIFAGVTAKTLADIKTDYEAYATFITASNAPQNSLADAKGDLFGASADNTPARVVAGSVNGHALVRDSAQTSGNKFSGALDHDLGQTGLFVPQWPTSFAALAPTASRAYYVRFCPSRDMAITAIAFVTSTAAGSADAFDVGIYSFSGSNLTRIASSGAQTSATVGGALNATAGVRSMNLTGTASLTAGTVYYAALSFGTFGGTAVQIVTTNTVSGNMMDIFGTAVGTQLGFFKASSHPLGAGPISTFTTTNQIPVLALKE